MLKACLGKGRGSFYTEFHLKRLNEISSLKAKGLSNPSILRYNISTDEGMRQYEARIRDLWFRYKIQPGIELHVSQKAEEKGRRMIDEILRLLRAVVEDTGIKKPQGLPNR
jgi:hypothetical protein